MRNFFIFICCSSVGYVNAVKNEEPEFEDKKFNQSMVENSVHFFLYHRSNFAISDELVVGDEDLLNKSRYNSDLPTTILIHGWTHGRDTPWMIEMREAMANKSSWNVIIVDWSPLARTLYTEARVHSPTVARIVGNLCLYLNKMRGLRMSDIHFVGHSMGAQISAMTSAYIKQHLTEKIGRITGLDPAAPLYEWPHMESSEEVIDPSDAIFVDVIHTNGNYLGMISPCGHVDYYPNGGMHQPGCTFWLCSHMRAVEFWTASIKNPFVFKAFPFGIWNRYVHGDIEGVQSYPMGIAADPRVPKGVYFLETVDEVPYIHTKTTMLLTANPKEAGDRKIILPEEKYSSTNFLTLWDFKGYFEISPLFYGWYTNSDNNKRGYRLPLAYLITGLVVYAYSFFATLRKMAKNSRMSKLSEKDDECIFSWKLFTAWDYMIGNSEAAHNRVASVIMGFKEALLEEAEKKREVRNWKTTTSRVFVNIVILGLFTCSAGSVVYLVKRSTETEGQQTFWRRNELTIVMSLISLIFPMLFDAMGYFESYHPRKQLRIQLARIMLLNLLNLYSLIISQFDRIHGMSDEMTDYFKNLTSQKSLDSLEGDPFERPFNIPIDKDVIYCFRKCYRNTTKVSKPLLIASLVLNSSILDQKLGSNITNLDNTKIITTLPNFFSSSLSEEGSSEDYPNYHEYFAQYEEKESSPSDFSTTSKQDYSSSSSDYYNQMDTSTWLTTVEEDISTSSQFQEYTTMSTVIIKPDEEDEKSKYTDYLTFILSKVDDNTTDLQSKLLDESTDTPFISTLEPTSSISTDETNTPPSFYGDPTEEIEVTTTYKSKEYSTIHETAMKESENTTPYSPTLNTNTNVETMGKTCEAPSEKFDDQPQLCEWVCEEEKPINMTEVGYLIRKMNNTDRKKLRALCWETMFGQDLIKLTVMDLIMTFLSTMAVDFFRAVFVRVMNNCWCWDLEKVFPKYSDFKVAENILHLVNNQGMIWMGLFFSPGLAVVNVVKLFVLMYLRAWTVLTCNVPPEVIFRASKSNNFYYALLLMMLFLCVLPVGYAMVVIEPSWYCGPFSGYKRMYTILTETITKITPRSFDHALQYAVSPGSIIPLLVLLILIIYYLTSLTSSLREANAELKFQLRRERTEERRKVFQLVDRRRRVGSGGSDPNNPFHKWKKLLSTFPAGKSIEDPGKMESFDQSLQSESAKEGKDFFSKLIRKALGRSSISDNNNCNRDDASDLDQQDSLPHDVNKNDTNENSIPKRRTSSSTSRNLHQLVAILTANKEKDEQKDEVKTKEEEDDNNSKIFDGSFSKRQESVSSNRSDNIPVITISDIELLDSRGKKNKTSTIDATKTSSGLSEKEKFKPKIKYALTKQSSEIDEESIRHFHRDILKQKSQTLVHDIYREDGSEDNSVQKDTKKSESQRMDKTSTTSEETRVTFRNIDSEFPSLDRKDSVFH